MLICRCRGPWLSENTQTFLRKAANWANKSSVKGNSVLAMVEENKQYIQEIQRLDMEAAAKEWLKGTYMEGDLLVRPGT